VNARVERLRLNLSKTKPEICPERARYFTEAMKKSEGESIAIRRAKALDWVLEKMTIRVLEDELIVGNQASRAKATPIYPEYSVDWIEKEFGGKPYYFHERPGDKFFYTEETKDEILALLDYWRGKSTYENLRRNLPEECNKAWDMGVIDDTWVSSAGFGNVIVDYDLVLKKGLNYVIEKAEDRIKRLDLTQPDEIKKYWFLNSVIITNKAVLKFAQRFAAECRQMAIHEKNEQRKSELLKIAENCRNVPAKPAQTFHEAVQSVWFTLLVIHIETNGHAISLGRFDQYLQPFYSRDIELKTITREQGLELIEAFFIKANELNKLRSWPDTEFFLGYQMFINLAVAGQTALGNDAINEVSRLCVEACGDLKLVTPSVSIKCFAGTDDKFIDFALQALNNHKGGQPAFYNDRAFMRILKNFGIDDEDLYNWAPDGCIEASIPGKWDFAAKGPWLNIAKVLEITLNKGTEPLSGITLLPADQGLTTFKNMDELVAEFKRQLHYFMELQVITEHINDEMHKTIDINAFRASLISDCIERGLSLLEGGSIYSVDGGPTAGTITTGDALAAIDYVLFQKKVLTSEQLFHALATNFEDMSTNPTGQEIRHLLLNKCPKFGNDNDEADKWSVLVAEYIGSSYRNDFKNSRYGKGPKPCCYGYSQSPVTGNIAFGGLIGATPDGRKAKDPVNNGISPCNGKEKTGPTASINSVGKMPSIWFQKGAIFNMRLSQTAMDTPEGRDRIATLIKTLFNKDGLHIQFNVVDNETLRAAQINPEEYEDLMVRVSGYSALFTPLAPKVQNDLIGRIEFEL